LSRRFVWIAAGFRIVTLLTSRLPPVVILRRSSFPDSVLGAHEIPDLAEDRIELFLLRRCTECAKPGKMIEEKKIECGLFRTDVFGKILNGSSVR